MPNFVLFNKFLQYLVRVNLEIRASVGKSTWFFSGKMRVAILANNIPTDLKLHFRSPTLKK